jgi:hypothetical protein
VWCIRGFAFTFIVAAFVDFAGADAAAAGALLAAGGVAEVVEGAGAGAAGGLAGGAAGVVSAGAGVAAGGELSAAGAVELSVAPLCCATLGSDPATNAAIATPPNQIRVFMGYVLFSLGFPSRTQLGVAQTPGGDVGTNLSWIRSTWEERFAFAEIRHMLRSSTRSTSVAQ